jgi:large subunit ribosomal protein L30
MLRVTLTKGLVGKKDVHIKVVRALGLRKFGSSALHHDSPTIRGMVNKVHYLVTVTEEAEGAESKKPAKAAKAAAPKAAAAKGESKAPAAKAEPKTDKKETAKAAK